MRELTEKQQEAMQKADEVVEYFSKANEPLPILYSNNHLIHIEIETLSELINTIIELQDKLNLLPCYL